jgi:pseudaminic acid cytidylyltransferase
MAEEARATGLVAVIPARGGSKRVPRKNIRPFLGVPLLARTIALLAQGRLFDRVIVSTDDEEIAAVARAAGAEVPFRRPAELSTDFAETLPVIAHAIRELEARGRQLSYVACVYPAAVLLRPGDLHAAWELLRDSDADYVFTVSSFPYPIQRALRRTADGGCEMIWPEQRETRSQDLEPAFHDAGQFYLGRRAAWLQARPLFSRRSRVLELPRYRVQDIDTPEDWERAETIFRLLEREAPRAG